jgi:hypothetical protein
MEQWTVIRQAIAQNRDIAELMTAGLQGQRAGCRRSTKAGAVAARECMSVLPHLGKNAARNLPEGNFRIVVRRASL